MDKLLNTIKDANNLIIKIENNKMEKELSKGELENKRIMDEAERTYQETIGNNQEIKRDLKFEEIKNETFEKHHNLMSKLAKS